MFIFRYISFFFCVFLDNGDADPSREHLIAYGPPFRLQTRENPGKPGKTRENPGKPGYRPTPQNRALALKARFFRFFGASRNHDFLASHQNLKNLRICQTWEAHIAILELKTCFSRSLLVSTFHKFCECLKTMKSMTVLHFH